MNTVRILAAAVLAVSAAASSAALADSPRSPLFVAGKSWNGGFAGPVNLVGGGQPIASRKFDAPAKDTYAGPAGPRATTTIRIAPANVEKSAAAGGQHYADFSASRSYAN